MHTIIKLLYYSSYCSNSNELLYNDNDLQAPSSLRGLSQNAPHKSKMTDDHHLAKNIHHYNLATIYRF